ncbi:hypothetical protein CBQ28_11510 [Pseudoalteromonas sp. GCY]|uniref:sugar nucleotide-binding protein n=1 Tax=Pseudoalteromonas sp. GCY TaxID=2003316 RepID=UPI000BFECBE5|nr:sugar nucleotide-binding protein [Pseudoalteromonas sp. GCY]PHI36924.1 hypothetical protein CBQ28_11510 [Pseudoalteromonas sp. GCY]QQQ68317.1 sugar nucleotide-binding protein [Pseudoalteromonas sp. GCY]
MKWTDKTLIIGGDSVIGQHLRNKYSNIHYTSRRKDSNAIPFDLLDAESFSDLCTHIQEKGIKNVIILAGITSIEKCEKNQSFSQLVNVDRTITLLESLDTIGCFSVFISSNHVFSCRNAFTHWHAREEPISIYGFQKRQVENFITKNKVNAVIIRPSKIIAPPFPLIEDMVHALKNGDETEAFDNHYISPISLDFFIKQLEHVITHNRAGLLQISGNSNISYYSLIKMIAKELRLDCTRLLPIPAQSKGVTPCRHGTLEPYSSFDNDCYNQDIIDFVDDYCMARVQK